MKNSRIFKIISMMLSVMMVLTLFPTSALGVAEVTYTLTIDYQYEDGTEAAPQYQDTTLVEGAAYSVASPDIPGYSPDQATVSGTMLAGNVDVTVTYYPTSQTLTIYYQYDGGAEAATTYTHDYLTGEAYSVDSPDIPGYRPDQTTVSDTMAADNVEVTVVYHQIYTLTINYQYEDTTEAASQYTGGYIAGEAYSVISPDVTGYKPDQAVVSGTMSEGNVEAVVIYHPTYTLTINYQYADGSAAASQYTGEFVSGETYSVASPSITHYFPDQATVSGTMPGETVTVTVTYVSYQVHINVYYKSRSTVTLVQQFDKYVDYATLTAHYTGSNLPLVISLQGQTNYTLGWKTTDYAASDLVQNGTTGLIPTISSTSYSYVVDVVLKAPPNNTSYTVTYNSNGGTGTMIDPNSPYADDASFTVLANSFTAPTGQHFAGWNTQSDGFGTPYLVGSTYSIIGNITLYAQWEDDTYTVTYYANGGMDPVPVDSNEYLTNDAVTVLFTPEPTRTGYNFLGWSESSSATSAAYSSGGTTSFIMGSSDVSLYAVWENEDYMLSYNGNGGTTTLTDTTEYVIGDVATVQFSPVPTRAGYNFLGWSESPSATTATYTSGGTTTLTFGAADVTLYAVWENVIYSLSYNGNGGTTTLTDTTEYVIGNVATVQFSPEPTRTGYNFLGWSESASATTATYTSGGTTTLTFGAADVTLYAVWENVIYSLSYNGNGGTTTLTDTTEYVIGNVATVQFSPVPTRAGYNFLGWSESASATTATYTSGGTTTLTFGAADVTLYAVWENVIYSLSYNGNGGSTSLTDTTEYVIGNVATVQFSPVPTRAGYNFLGWSESASATTATYTSGGTTTLTFGAADVTLYAVWDILDYSVTYAEGTTDAVSGMPDDVTDVAYNSTFDVSAATPTRTGYTFAGWSTSDVTGSLQTYSASGSFTMPSNAVTLTATWDAIPEVHSFTFTFMQIAGSDENDLRTYRVSHNDASDIYYPVKLGYKISGTSTIVEIPSSFTFNHTTANRFSDPFYFTTNALGVDQSETCILYWWNASAGSWIQASTKASSALHKVTYDATGGTLNDPLLAAQYAFHGTAITEPTAERTGYTFDTWNYAPTINLGSVNASSTVTASWTANDYSVTYAEGTTDAVSGMPDDVTDVAYNSTFDVSAATPTRTGYTFAGWSTSDVTGSLQTYSASGSFTMPSNAVTLTATWDAIPEVHSFTFTFMQIAGSDENDLRTYRVSHNDASDIYYPVKLGYKISGTSTIVEIPSSFTFNHTTANRFSDPFYFTTNALGVDQSETCILYWWNASAGSWIQASTKASSALHKVTYDATGGTLNDPLLAAQYAFHGTAITEPTAERTGYTFDTWNYAPTINLGSVNASSTVTASWTDPIEYTITYVMNGGTNNQGNPDTYTVESPTITLLDPTRAGYNFIGWTPTNSIPTGSTENKTFTATWSDPIEYTITYVMNGGTNNQGNPDTYTVESPTITLLDPTRAGYNFIGWTPTNSIPTGSTENKTFTATWSDPIEYTITYVMNGGTNNQGNPDTYTVESPTITLLDPTYLGFTFVGWAPSDTILTGSTGDLIFTALWVPATFAVNYETGVAAVVTGMPADVPVVLFGSPFVVSPTIPVRAGFTFIDWITTDVNGTAQAYTSGDIFAMPANDVSLTATWVADLTPVNYNPNGGIGAEYTEGLHATLSLVTVDANSFTRPGYQFIGWSETPTGPITQQPGNTFVMPAYQVNFYAQWEQVFYTVTYMVTGGTLDGLDGDTPFATYGGLGYGDAVPVPADPAQEGYTFDGWTTAIPATMPEGNVTIYGTLTQITLRAEEIPDEPTPLATPSWALLNLILTIVTALAIVIIFTLLKKNREVELTKKSKAFRWSTLVPAIGAIVAFVLTEDMKNPMVLTDNWTLLMAGIAVVQALLITFALQKDKKEA